MKVEFKINGGINFYFVCCAIKFSENGVLLLRSRIILKGVDVCTLFNQGPLFTLELSRDPPKDKQDFSRFCHVSIFRFRKNSFFWRQNQLFLSCVNPNFACSLIRPWWFALKTISTSTVLLINNIFFSLSPHFLHFNLRTKIQRKVYAILFGPEKPPYTFFSIS